MKKLSLLMIPAMVIASVNFNPCYAQSKVTPPAQKPKAEEIFYKELVPARALDPKLFYSDKSMKDTAAKVPVFYKASDMQMLMGNKVCVEWVTETKTVKDECEEYKWVGNDYGGSYECAKWSYKTVEVKRCVRWQ